MPRTRVAIRDQKEKRQREKMGKIKVFPQYVSLYSYACVYICALSVYDWRIHKRLIRRNHFISLFPFNHFNSFYFCRSLVFHILPSFLPLTFLSLSLSFALLFFLFGAARFGFYVSATTNSAILSTLITSLLLRLIYVYAILHLQLYMCTA